jgi:catechol 2,3-dioxygenase-like lactoylglutathione lyase family enzyme
VPLTGHPAAVRYQLGALVDHIHLRVADLEASRRFYRAALTAVGRTFDREGADHFMSGELYVSAGGPVTSGLHLAFQAADRAAVQRFHAEAVAAGGTDNGGPGLREYADGYYAAFVLDPDGNNIEAVIHEGHHRSVAAVEVWTD